MSRPKVTVHGAFVRHGDGSCWTFPGRRLEEIGWRLRYGTPSREDELVAASGLDALMCLVSLDPERRETIVRRMREAQRIESAKGKSP